MPFAACPLSERSTTRKVLPMRQRRTSGHFFFFLRLPTRQQSAIGQFVAAPPLVALVGRAPTSVHVISMQAVRYQRLSTRSRQAARQASQRASTKRSSSNRPGTGGRAGHLPGCPHLLLRCSDSAITLGTEAGYDRRGPCLRGSPKHN
ncbi:hypothetical protein MPH_08321 [Macrophomina phaseolina MS6]|uniref:Uncharacterized protein n=1 Tax=Macrophomina phaseolina (strain MS6) TaxID=1126212 RepID=K2RNW6_MACPH|nr:hypothetical protein MPH_08321 [Macrophomina phaseolina MS6]